MKLLISNDFLTKAVVKILLKFYIFSINCKAFPDVLMSIHFSAQARGDHDSMFRGQTCARLASENKSEVIYYLSICCLAHDRQLCIHLDLVNII